MKMTCISCNNDIKFANDLPKEKINTRCPTCKTLLLVNYNNELGSLVPKYELNPQISSVNLGDDLNTSVCEWLITHTEVFRTLTTTDNIVSDLAEADDFIIEKYHKKIIASTSLYTLLPIFVNRYGQIDAKKENNTYSVILVEVTPLEFIARIKNDLNESYSLGILNSKLMTKILIKG